MAEQYPVYRVGSGFSFQTPDITPRPVTIEERVDPSIGGWINAVGDAIAMQPIYQSLYENMQAFGEEDEDYDPLSPENLAGYEQFSAEFIGIRSKLRQDFLKRRIDNNLRRRANIDRELGLGGILVSEVFNPVNYIPIPGIMGANFGVKTLGKATTILGGSLVAEEALRQQTDPTATMEESVNNVVYGTLFGSLLLGGLGAASGFKKADVDRWTEEYSQWSKFKLSDASAKSIDEPSVIKTTTNFEARPTGKTPTGVAKTILKTEKLYGLTFVGSMLSSGLRSVEDFTAGVLGDYGLMLERNKSGIATEQSAYLAADKWRGMAAQGTSDLRALYAEYRTGGPGKTVANINLFTDVQRASEAFGRRGGAGELMTYEEFQEAIFRAHKRDEIKADNSFVERGVGIVRNYFDAAEKAGIDSGAIRGPKGRRKFIERKTTRSRQIVAKIAELKKQIVSDAGPTLITPKQQAQLVLLSRQSLELMDDLLRVTKADLGDDATLVDVLNEIEVQGAARDKSLTDLKEDIIKSGADKKKFFEDLAAKIQKQFDDQIKNYEKIQAKLLKEQETRGLTEAQSNYLTILTEILDGGMPRKPTAKQKAIIEKAEAQKDLDPMDLLTQRQLDYLDLIDRKLAGIYDELSASPKNEKFYLPRFWQVDEVLSDVQLGEKSKLRKILRDWYTDNPLPGTRIDPDSINARVEKSIEKIVGLAELGEMQLKAPKGKGASFLKSRDIDIPNELVADFIETDLERLMRTYGDRFGMIQEYTVKFGDTTMDDAINDVLLAALEDIEVKNVGEAMQFVDSLQKNLEQVRDIGTGNIYSTDAKMMNRRKVSGWLRGYGTITALGGAGLSSLTEIPRAMMVHGFGRVFSATLEKTFGNPDLYKSVSKKLASQTMQGMEVYNSGALQRFAQSGGPTGGSTSRTGRAAQKMTDFANGPFQIMSGLAPFTDWAKGFSQFMTHNFFLEDIVKIANGKGSDKMIADFASYGLSRSDIAKIAQMPLEKEGSIYLANMESWPDEALALRYASAVNGMTRRIIPTASKQDLPLIAQGFIKGREFPLLTLPFQFMAYGFAANNKVLTSALQGRDKSAFLGMASMIGAGYAVASLKAHISGSSWYWDQANATERMVRAVDQSGIAGIYSEIPTLVEAATLGEVGIRPALGLEPYSKAEDYVEALGDVAGPAPSKIMDLMLTITDDDASASQVGGAIRRSLPFNNLFYLNALFKAAQKKITDQFEDSDIDLATDSVTYYGK